MSKEAHIWPTGLQSMAKGHGGPTLRLMELADGHPSPDRRPAVQRSSQCVIYASSHVRLIRCSSKEKQKVKQQLMKAATAAIGFQAHKERDGGRAMAL